MKVGFYKSCITPPIGTPMAGYAARRDVSKGVHDDLYARAVSMYDGNDEWIIVSFIDLSGGEKINITYISKEISVKTLLPKDLTSVKTLLREAKNTLDKALQRKDFNMEMKARLDLWRARRIMRLYKIYGYNTMNIG